ncbi:hypothetical protein B0H11DRAFT_665722 [Mycena galericulata]|nr:hypothetical protein B0H11DRAFT_665722 [Mycena galericulata]
MQCSFLVALVMSCLALSISGAPVPASNPDAGLAILDRTSVCPRALPPLVVPIRTHPLQESTEVARAPEPEPACRLYSCI